MLFVICLFLWRWQPNIMLKSDFCSSSSRLRPRPSLHDATKTTENTHKSEPISKRIYRRRLLGTFVVLLSCFTLLWQHLHLVQYHHVRQLRSNLLLLPLRKPRGLIDIINFKYKYGRPSNILAENGLLIHMAHSMGNWGMDIWSNDPDKDGAKHLSCSIINAQNPHVFPQGNPYFTPLNNPHTPVGYILEDTNTPIQCVFPKDGGTNNSPMKDSEWSGCACLGDNPYSASNSKSVFRPCMMPSTQLKEMMEESKTSRYSHTYNEVIISKQYWKDSSPSGHAILAFFYVKGSPDIEEVVASHKNYLRYTHQNSSQTPLLEYDATNEQQPFVEHYRRKYIWD